MLLFNFLTSKTSNSAVSGYFLTILMVSASERTGRRAPSPGINILTSKTSNSAVSRYFLTILMVSVSEMTGEACPKPC
jgi:hypothetical protein